MKVKTGSTAKTGHADLKIIDLFRKVDLFLKKELCYESKLLLLLKMSTIEIDVIYPSGVVFL